MNCFPRTGARESDDRDHTTPRALKAIAEGAGLLRDPRRAAPLLRGLFADAFRLSFEQRHLYSYTTTKRSSEDLLKGLLQWILEAQGCDGGIAAYYSLLSGYSRPYPEVTGYLIPTLYDYAKATGEDRALAAAERATRWVISLQMPTGAFPGGLHGVEAQPSVFNTGQILQGLVRAFAESNNSETREAATAAGDWLSTVQHANGSWSGQGAYQGQAHTYYSMVSWSLCELSKRVHDPKYGQAAERNLNWMLPNFETSGWVDGINLRGHPTYLHFIAYALQGALESAILLRRDDVIQSVAKSAWVLLRKFETNKFLPGAYQRDFKSENRFACLTGNAQMSCVWLRLYQVTEDLRYLNAALKMNEMLKQLIPGGAAQGIAGGVSGSYPLWGSYQPLRYISWGCKFFADALLQEQRLKRAFAASSVEAFPCAS